MASVSASQYPLDIMETADETFTARQACAVLKCALQERKHSSNSAKEQEKEIRTSYQTSIRFHGNVNVLGGAMGREGHSCAGRSWLTA